MYKDALQKGPSFGGRRTTKLALTLLKTRRPARRCRSSASPSRGCQRRHEGHWDSMVKLSEIFLAVARDKPVSR